MRSLAPDVRDIRYQATAQLTLDPEAPLLRVWPHCFCRNGRKVKWKKRSAGRDGTRRIYDASTRTITWIKGRSVSHIADACVIYGKLLRHTEDQGCACFQRAGIRFVPSAVFEKDPVPSPNRSLTVSNRMPSKAYSRCGVKKMFLQGAGGSAIDATSDQPQIRHYAWV